MGAVPGLVEVKLIVKGCAAPRNGKIKTRQLRERLAVLAARVGRQETFVLGVIVVKCQPDLFQVVGALQCAWPPAAPGEQRVRRGGRLLGVDRERDSDSRRQWA